MSTSYSYRAVRHDGALECGLVEAPERETAARRLGARGLFALELRPEEARVSQGRMPSDQLALGLRLLADFLEAGIPMTRALAALADVAPPAWQIGLPKVQESVREGRTLSASLGVASLGLPALILGIVSAGEAGSGLAAAVRRAAELTEASAATRAAVRGALAYPLVLAVAGGISVTLLVGLVLPRFAAILEDLGQALPPATRLVLEAGAVARLAALPALVGTLLLLAIWRAWMREHRNRIRWHELLLELPVLGAARRSAAASRVAAALGGLLEAGVPIARALLHAARAAGDAAIEHRVLAVREEVLTGRRLHAALAANDALTATVSRLVRAGEETGRLAPLLLHASRLEAQQAERRVKAAVRLLEPSLVIGFGAVIAIVAAALLQALYGVRPV